MCAVQAAFSAPWGSHTAQHVATSRAKCVRRPPSQPACHLPAAAPQPPPPHPPRLACSDNLRGFFEQCFPTLLKRLFGYDGTSWLNLVARVS